MSIGIQVYTMDFLIITEKLYKLKLTVGKSFSSTIQEYKIKIKFVKLPYIRYLA